jgi:integration host factor subunit alpha
VTITKADIVECIYEKVGFSKKEAAEIVEALFEIIKRQFEHGERIKLSGFGNFVIHEKARAQKPQPAEAEQRRYRRKDVETFLEIRRLLYTERYTIEGARRRLRDRSPPPPRDPGARKGPGTPGVQSIGRRATHAPPISCQRL